MATSIPPHNLGEVCDALLAYLDNPAIELDEIMEYLPGPDFRPGPRSAAGWASERRTVGPGSCAGAAKYAIEEQKDGDRRSSSPRSPTSLPRSLCSRSWLSCQRRADTGVSNIDDFSDSKQPVRIAVTVKKAKTRTSFSTSSLSSRRCKIPSA
jgi:DNA gyrase subunit A